MGEVVSYTKEGIDDLLEALSGAGFVTQAEVDATIAALVDSAPTTLDTLNELAAAIGDDADFLATLNAAVDTKLTQSEADLLYEQLPAAPSDPVHIGTVSVGAGVGGARTDWTLTPHANTQVGDLLVFSIATQASITVTVPGAYTLVASEVGGVPDTRVYIKVATAGDLGIPAVFVSTSSYGTAHLTTLRGPTAFQASAASTSATDGSGVATAPTVTSTVDKAVALRLFSVNGSSGHTWNMGAGLTELGDVSGYISLGLAMSVVPLAGPSGAATATSTPAQTFASTSQLTVILQQAPPPANLTTADLDVTVASVASQSKINSNNQTGTAYGLVLADAGKVVELNNAATVTVTVPTNGTQAFPIDSVIELWQQGAGQVIVAPAGGVTIRSTEGKLKLYGQYAAASLRKRGTDEWVLVGDLVA